MRFSFSYCSDFWNTEEAGSVSVNSANRQAETPKLVPKGTKRLFVDEHEANISSDYYYCVSLAGRFNSLDKKEKAHVRRAIENAFFDIECGYVEPSSSQNSQTRVSPVNALT